MATQPITSLLKTEQQHMLFLFLPIKTGFSMDAQKFGDLLHIGQGIDTRAATGVHFFMTYFHPAGAPSPIIVPTFQGAAPGGKAKNLLVVMSIYDDDFKPYISSFLDDDKIVEGLTGVLTAMDESGLGLAEDDPSTATNILKGGLRKNPKAFLKLLMRYNFADPTIPAVGPGGRDPDAPPSTRYFLGGTFPGLTIGKILGKDSVGKDNTGYPQASELWPSPAGGKAPKIHYDPSDPSIT